MGFYVYEITPEKFASDGGEKIGSITVICDGASVPKSLEEPLERYLTQNGRLFIFGGPLFGIDNITEKAPVIEGISPLYKTFAQEKCESFETLENAVTDATLHGSAARTICPNARPIGEGFDMGHRCRFLPLVSVKNGDDGARDGGKNQPIEWRLEEQRQYQAQFNRLFGFCASKGSMRGFIRADFALPNTATAGMWRRTALFALLFANTLKAATFSAAGKARERKRRLPNMRTSIPKASFRIGVNSCLRTAGNMRRKTEANSRLMPAFISLKSVSEISPPQRGSQAAATATLCSKSGKNTFRSKKTFVIFPTALREANILSILRRKSNCGSVRAGVPISGKYSE